GPSFPPQFREHKPRPHKMVPLQVTDPCRRDHRDIVIPQSRTKMNSRFQRSDRIQNLTDGGLRHLKQDRARKRSSSRDRWREGPKPSLLPSGGIDGCFPTRMPSPGRAGKSICTSIEILPTTLTCPPRIDKKARTTLTHKLPQLPLQSRGGTAREQS